MNNPRKWVVLIPLLLVNGVAVTGQLLFWRIHLPTWPLIAVITFALSLESLGVFLAYHASLAELSQDSALRLRFASYGAGITIGLINASHYLNNGRITAAAVGMFILSASSPWLWAINTRRQSRDALKSLGLIEDRALKLGILRWTLWPNRAFPVFRNAVWAGENSPATAIRIWEHGEEQRAQERPSDPREELEASATRADAIRVALRESGLTTASDIARWLHDRGVKGVSAAHVRQVRSTDARKDSQERRESIRALPTGSRGSDLP